MNNAVDEKRNSLLTEIRSFNDYQFTWKVTGKKLIHLTNHKSGRGFF